MKYSTRLAAFSAILAACGIFQTTGFADSYSSENGGTTTDWNTLSTWHDNTTSTVATSIPGGTDTVETDAFAHTGNTLNGGSTPNIVTVGTVISPESVSAATLVVTFSSTLDIPSGSSVATGGLTVSSGGTINLSGTLSDASTGQLNILTGSVITQSGSSSSFTASDVFQPATGSLTVPAYTISAGTANFNKGVQDGTTLVSQTGGTVNSANGQFILGNFTNATWKISGGTLNISGNNNWLGNNGGSIGILQVIGHTAAINITTTNSTALVMSHTAGSHGEFAFQVDNGGTSTPQIIDDGGATINAGSLLDMSWVNGTGATAGAIYELFQAPTAQLTFPSGTLTSNLHLASNPEDADFSYFTVTNGGNTILEAELLVSIPEPATLGIFAIGATALLARRRRARA